MPITVRGTRCICPLVIREFQQRQKSPICISTSREDMPSYGRARKLGDEVDAHVNIICSGIDESLSCVDAQLNPALFRCTYHVPSPGELCWDNCTITMPYQGLAAAAAAAADGTDAAATESCAATTAAAAPAGRSHGTARRDPARATVWGLSGLRSSKHVWSARLVLAIYVQLFAEHPYCCMGNDVCFFWPI